MKFIGDLTGNCLHQLRPDSINKRLRTNELLQMSTTENQITALAALLNLLLWSIAPLVDMLIVERPLRKLVIVSSIGTSLQEIILAQWRSQPKLLGGQNLWL